MSVYRESLCLSVIQHVLPHITPTFATTFASDRALSSWVRRSYRRRRFFFLGQEEFASLGYHAADSGPRLATSIHNLDSQ